MTPDEIWSIQDSFSHITPQAEAAGVRFYTRLFAIAPELRPLFDGDMRTQGMKFMTTLGVVVKAFSDFQAMLPLARQLAVDHVAFGVRPDHYAPVGEALVWTMRETLGREFTEDVQDAWARAYRLLSSEMIKAAYPDDAG